MIKSRIEDRMTEAFEGFEPEVQGQWSDLEQQLDAQGTVQDVDMVKRVRSAERFAIGATAVAAGLTLWMAYPLISESTVDDRRAGYDRGDAMRLKTTDCRRNTLRALTMIWGGSQA